MDDAAHGYVSARFFGAPASLSIFAINGWLLGLGRTRAALALQIVMNLVNIGLRPAVRLAFPYGRARRRAGHGLRGMDLACGRPDHRRARDRVAAILSPALFGDGALKRLFAVNADIMVRTVALLLMFVWFTNAGARLGATALAANHVLMQFVSVSAFVLDGFAFTAESRVGQAIGARSRGTRSIRAIRLTGEFSLWRGIGFALLFLRPARPLIAFFVEQPGRSRPGHGAAPLRRDHPGARHAGMAARRHLHRRDPRQGAAQRGDRRDQPLYRDRSGAPAVRRDRGLVER